MSDEDGLLRPPALAAAYYLLEEARSERDEVREKYCDILTYNMLHIATIERLGRERDEARNKMAEALGTVDLITLDFERMREQRDTLVAAIQKLRDAKGRYHTQIAFDELIKLV